MRVTKLEDKGDIDSLGRRGVLTYLLVALVALIGLADATYLTVMHFTGDDALCGPGADCSKVLGSVYASIGPLPTASFGMVAYFVVFSAAVFALFGKSWARGLLSGSVTVMLLVSLWLLYLQAFVLHAFCPFCLLSAALTFLLAGILLATSPVR